MSETFEGMPLLKVCRVQNSGLVPKPPPPQLRFLTTACESCKQSQTGGVEYYKDYKAPCEPDLIVKIIIYMSFFLLL